MKASWDTGRVLYIEGVADAAVSMRSSLVSVLSWPLEVCWVETVEEGISELRRVGDTVLIAIDSEAELSAISALIAEHPSVAIVVVTQNRDVSFALRASELGARMSYLRDDISIESLVRQLYLLSCRGAHTASVSKHLQQIFSTTISSADESVWDWDLISGNTRCFVPNFYSMTGYSESDFSPSFELWQSAVHPDDLPHVMTALEQHLLGGALYETEYRFRQESGEYCWLLVRGYCHRDAQARPVRMSGTVRDITERKRMQEQEKRLLLLEQQREFLATLTHDLKMPLIGAGRIYDLALDGAFGDYSAEQISIFEGLRTSNKQVLEMIQNHIELYRVEQISYLRHPAELDLSDLVSGLCAHYSAICASDVRLSCHCDPELRLIEADESAMRRMIHNLLGNAAKFTPSGGTIDVRLFNDNGGVTLSVSDSGPGVPPDELETIYQRLYQGTVGKYYSDSCGLGLYVCKRIAEAHGGTISCLSEPGKGASFFVRLPCSLHAPEVGVL